MSEATISSISTTPVSNADSSADRQLLKEKAAAAKHAVAELAGEAKRYASHRVAAAKDKAADWVDVAKDKAGNYNHEVIEFVQRNPYKSVALALGIGFVAGLILKRR